MGEARHNGGRLSRLPLTNRSQAPSDQRRAGLRRLAALVALLCAIGACAWAVGLPLLAAAVASVATDAGKLALGLVAVATAYLLWDKARMERETTRIKSTIDLEQSYLSLERSQIDLEKARLEIVRSRGRTELSAAEPHDQASSAGGR